MKKLGNNPWVLLCYSLYFSACLKYSIKQKKTMKIHISVTLLALNCLMKEQYSDNTSAKHTHTYTTKAVFRGVIKV